MRKYLIFFSAFLFLLSLFLVFPETAKSWLNKPVGDSCIAARNIFKIDSIDSIHNGFYKPAIENLTPQIKVCYPNYKYPDQYIDHEMRIIFPAYLKILTYEFTDNQFTIRFDDDKGDRTICIFYDFANEMKTTLLNYSKNDGQKVRIEKINGNEIIFSKNWQGKYTASIFLKNGISVAYYTKEAKYSNELQESILGFSMN